MKKLKPLEYAYREICKAHKKYMKIRKLIINHKKHRTLYFNNSMRSNNV